MINTKTNRICFSLRPIKASLVWSRNIQLRDDNLFPTDFSGQDPIYRLYSILSNLVYNDEDQCGGEHACQQGQVGLGTTGMPWCEN